MNALINFYIVFFIIKIFAYIFMFIYCGYPRAITSKERWQDIVTVVSSSLLVLILLESKGVIAL